MKKTDIRKLYLSLEEYADKEVVLAGWVRSVRDLKNFCFIDLNDGTSFKGAQIVFTADNSNYSEVSKLNAGSSIICNGKIIVTPNSKQPFEMNVRISK